MNINQIRFGSIIIKDVYIETANAIHLQSKDINILLRNTLEENFYLQ